MTTYYKDEFEIQVEIDYESEEDGVQEDKIDEPYEIEVCCDGVECDQFVAWLNAHGHDAHLGNSTASYVNGYSTRNEKAGEILQQLWEEYCDQ